MVKEKKVLGKNQFFDINKLPKEEGLILFPISMSRIDNSQNATNCMKYVKVFLPKVNTPNIGVNFIYGDFLYLYSDEKARVLKDKFMHQIVNHRNSLQKLIYKDRYNFQIQQAFEFMSWSQLYLGFESFPESLKKLKEIYKKDKNFQKYVKEDSKFFKKKLDKNQLEFFLEEHLFVYLALKGKITFPNKYIQGREKWILICYPGRAPKGLIYLFKLNPFNLHNPKNKYENIVTYNPETKELYDIENIDLETYKLK